MHRDIPSGIRRIPRALTSILVQQATLPVDTTGATKQDSSSSSPPHQLAVEVGIATCTGARSLFSGEAWAVGDSTGATSSSSSVQIGVMDSRDGRSFPFLNAGQQAGRRHWGNHTLSYLSQSRQPMSSSSISSFSIFAGYGSNRGAYSAVTPASIVASNLARQQFPPPSAAAAGSSHTKMPSTGSQLHAARGDPSSPSVAASAVAAGNSFFGGQSDSTVSSAAAAQSFSADFHLRSALLGQQKGEEGGHAEQDHEFEAKNFLLRRKKKTAVSGEKKQQQQQQQKSEADSSSATSDANLDPLTSGCRGIWASLRSGGGNVQKQQQQQEEDDDDQIVHLDLHSVGDCRAVLVLGDASYKRDKSFGAGRDKTRLPSDRLLELQNLAKELPAAFQVEKRMTPSSLDLEEAVLSDRKKNTLLDTPTAIHEKLIERRNRLLPLTVDHRPLRPEEQRRIGNAVLRHQQQPTQQQHKQQQDLSSSTTTKIPREFISDDEFMCGDAAVDVSRAFGHFHLKNTPSLGPGEQLLVCTPESSSRAMRAGDVLVLGNKAVFQGFGTQKSSGGDSSSGSFVGGWSVTLDSLAAHVLEGFSGVNEGQTASDVAKGIVQLSMLSGAEHNLSVVVLRVVEQDAEKKKKMPPMLEYAIPGQVHPWLLQQQQGGGAYRDALRRDAWRLGFPALQDFAAARQQLLEERLSSMFELLRRNGGSSDRPSIDCPEELWVKMTSPVLSGTGLLESHPQMVSSLIRELQSEYEWCCREAKGI